MSMYIWIMRTQFTLVEMSVHFCLSQRLILTEPTAILPLQLIFWMYLDLSTKCTSQVSFNHSNQEISETNWHMIIINEQESSTYKFNTPSHIEMMYTNCLSTFPHHPSDMHMHLVLRYRMETLERHGGMERHAVIDSSTTVEYVWWCT